MNDIIPMADTVLTRRDQQDDHHESFNIVPQSETPFPYQVAGHGALLKISGGKICKPLIEREYQFYKSLQKTESSLAPFVAKFFGTTTFTFTDEQLDEWISKAHEAELKKDSKFEADDDHINPWSAKVTKQTLSKLQRNSDSNGAHDYLVLEDLTYKYKRPSISDIKIGTRQHGDDAAPDKKKRHMQKCATTTSTPLGIRLCGQLVYEPESKTYRHHDKYYGRQLTKDSIQPAVAEFFNNGTTFRMDILHQFIVKLKELLNAVQEEHNCRFYSSSLLLIYEGDHDENDKLTPSVDVKIIDFAHTFSYVPGEVQDDGYIFGLSNFIRMMEQIASEKQHESTSHESQTTN